VLLHNFIRYDGQPLLWDRAFRCAVTIGGPAFAGVLFNNTDLGLLAVIAALWAWMNDLGGALDDRLRNMTASTVATVVGGALGIIAGPHYWPQLFVLFIISLDIGWVHNTSRALENAGRCLGFAFVIVTSLRLTDPLLAVAVLAGGGWAMLVAWSDYAIRRGYVAETGSNVRSGLRRFFTEHQPDWRFGLRYGLAAALGLGLAEQLGATHAAWVTITTLAVMRPTESESIDLVLQRAFGTLIGVLAALAVVSLTHNPWMLVVGAMGFAFFIAPGMQWQRWSGFAALTAAILVTLDLALLTEGGDRPLLLERLLDTLLGCAIALGATWMIFPERRPGAAADQSGARKR
jgi:uncharacterized membrane protein YccC